MDLFRIADI